MLGDLPEFNRKVYAIARTIPPGSTLTYGEIAERLGDRLLARDVGQALGQNPIPLIDALSSCARCRRQDRRASQLRAASSANCVC